MQMELNYDLDPRAQESEGLKNKWTLVPLFSTLQLWSLGTSAAWPGSEKYPEL